eukprot:482552-Pelagomonas_calceolata.AAC.4
MSGMGGAHGHQRLQQMNDHDFPLGVRTHQNPPVVFLHHNTCSTCAAQDCKIVQLFCSFSPSPCATMCNCKCICNCYFDCNNVQLLGPSSPSPAVRMYALLILGRLASRSSAVQVRFLKRVVPGSFNLQAQSLVSVSNADVAAPGSAKRPLLITVMLSDCCPC